MTKIFSSYKGSFARKRAEIRVLLRDWLYSKSCDISSSLPLTLVQLFEVNRDSDAVAFCLIFRSKYEFTGPGQYGTDEVSGVDDEAGCTASLDVQGGCAETSRPAAHSRGLETGGQAQQRSSMHYVL